MSFCQIRYEAAVACWATFQPTHNFYPTENSRDTTCVIAARMAVSA